MKRKGMSSAGTTSSDAPITASALWLRPTSQSTRYTSVYVRNVATHIREVSVSNGMPVLM